MTLLESYQSFMMVIGVIVLILGYTYIKFKKPIDKSIKIIIRILKFIYNLFKRNKKKIKKNRKIYRIKEDAGLEDIDKIDEGLENE